MSLCIVLQEYDRIFMSGDSATSGGEIDNLVRYDTATKKITKVGNDIVFCSGLVSKSDAVMNFIKNYYNIYKTPIINDQFTTFLQNAIGMQTKPGVYDVGVLIGRIDTNGQSVVYEFSQYNDFKVVEHWGKNEGTQVWCAGFKTNEALNFASECLSNKLSVIDTYIKTYESVSCTEVGGTITVFQTDKNSTKMILRQPIKESNNIRWFNSLGTLRKEPKTDDLPLNHFSLPEDAHNVLADVLCGEVVISEKLKIENASGNWNLTDNGLEAISGVYSVGINPSVPSEIFHIQIAGDNVFYIDAQTGKLVFEGTLKAVNGQFTGSLNGNYISGATIEGGTISGVIVNGSTINGGTFHSDNPDNAQETTIEGGMMTTNALICDGGSAGQFMALGNYLQMWNPTLQETFHLDGTGNMMCKTLDCQTINNGTAITSLNLQSQMNSLLVSSPYSLVANTSNNTGWAWKAAGIANSSSDSNTVYVSVNGNFRPVNSDYVSCGTSGGLWSSVWSSTAAIQTSDERKKNSIEDLDSRYEMFFDLLISKRFKMNNGTSNRYHVGWISQDIEEALATAGLSSLEFAGFVKDPIYKSMKLDADGNETDEYDTNSEIVDYNYFLRYEEFISLVAHKVKCVEKKYSDRIEKIEQQLNQLLESEGR